LKNTITETVYIIYQYFLLHILCVYFRFQTTGSCGRDCMIAEFTTTYAISTYHQ